MNAWPHRQPTLPALAWATIVSVTLAGCASPPELPRLAVGQQDQAMAHLAAYIHHEMAEANAPGLSIAIVDEQGVRFEQGFGWADRARHVQADGHTLYRVGSVSKLFTDVAALQLATQGRLGPQGLDTPVRQFLPNFAPQAPDGVAYAITPRMLMTHHSGLPRDVLKGFMVRAPAPFCTVLEALNAQGADDVPQRSFSYSNAGLSVLGCVVAQASGQPFEAWASAQVLQPLDMHESAFEAQPGQHSPIAQGHAHGQPDTEPGLRDVPAGGLTSSVHDLANFMRMVLNKGEFNGRQVLPTAAVQAMFTRQNADVALDGGFPVGLGWMLGSLSLAAPQGAGVVAHHAGGTRLFRSQMYVLPEQHIGVVVLANDQGAEKLVDRVALRALAVTLQVKSGMAWPAAATTAPIATPAWASTTLDAATNAEDDAHHRWAGLYTTFVGPVRIAQAAGQAPQAQAFGHTLDLKLRPDGTRSLNYALLGLLPLPLGELGEMRLSRQDIQGVDALVGRLGATSMLLGSRVPATAVPQSWVARTGAYDLINADAPWGGIHDLQLLMDEGQLFLQFKDTASRDSTPQRLLLRARSDRAAQVLQLLPDAGPMLRVVDTPEGEALALGGYLARRRSP